MLVFKDLQKLVSAQQKENTRKELFQRLQDKSFAYGTNSSISKKTLKQMGIECH